MSKRSVAELMDADDVGEAPKKAKVYEHVNKHTLDSEEEDSDVEENRWDTYVCVCVYVYTCKRRIFDRTAIDFNDQNVLLRRYNVLDEEDIQGEEDGVSKMDGEVKVNIS